MDFLVDLNANPGPIPVRAGSSTFQLHHRFFDAYERGRVVDMLQIGIEAAMLAAHQKIDSWTGVTDAAGTPLPLKIKHPDGREESNLGLVMGRIPFAEQLAVFFRQMAVNGVRFNSKVMRKTVQQYVEDEKAVDAFVEDIESFFGSGVTPPAAPSGVSASSATSPTPSA